MSESATRSNREKHSPPPAATFSGTWRTWYGVHTDQRAKLVAVPGTHLPCELRIVSADFESRNLASFLHPLHSLMMEIGGCGIQDSATLSASSQCECQRVVLGLVWWSLAF